MRPLENMLLKWHHFPVNVLCHMLLASPIDVSLPMCHFSQKFLHILQVSCVCVTKYEHSGLNRMQLVSLTGFDKQHFCSLYCAHAFISPSRYLFSFVKQIERTLLEETVKTLNSYYAEAEKIGGQSYLEGCLACATAYIIFFCMETRYEKVNTPKCYYSKGLYMF